MCFTLFFFNDTATTEIYTLSLHDALPISAGADHRLRAGEEHRVGGVVGDVDVRALDAPGRRGRGRPRLRLRDRKSTRLNSSHQIIPYAVFCLKKKQIRVHKREVQASIPSS